MHISPAGAATNRNWNSFSMSLNHSDNIKQSKYLRAEDETRKTVQTIVNLLSLQGRGLQLARVI